jgi:glycosyltransferase involved in cell wall biosynthesis
MSVPDAKTVTVYAGVDEEFWRRDRHDARALRRELGLPDDTVIYLYFGRPGVSKGVEFLVDAVPLVRKELPGSKLVLIMTDDPPRQAMRIRERIAERGVTGDVIILPPQTREALAGALLASDCVVVPSLSEGFGYAAVEAAMLGCNVVTTSGHAVEEVIPNNAVFAAPRDATALARAIVDAVTSPNRERPPLRFPIDRSVQGVLAAYERIADYP